jgi:hypothetical protein
MTFPRTFEMQIPRAIPAWFNDPKKPVEPGGANSTIYIGMTTDDPPVMSPERPRSRRASQKSSSFWTVR